MTEVSFLAYLPDPFSVREPAFFVLGPDGVSSRLGVNELGALTGHLVTYEVIELLDELRRHGKAAPRHLIDVGEALRIIVGVPKDEGGERQWSFWRRVAPHFQNSKAAKKFEAVAKSRLERPSEPRLTEMLAHAATALSGLWAETKAQLSERGEYERFNEIEVPVQSIFAHRQQAGIAVDRAEAHRLLQTLESEKYQAYQRVAKALNRSPTGLNFWNIAPRLGSTDAAHLSEMEGGRLRDAFKIAAVSSSFASDFLQLTEATQDEIMLRRAAGLEPRLYPAFALTGTVTGRILVSDPPLQQLRRRYRGIVRADPGKRLIYLDYAQFEPGILAFLSGDRELITAYANGDLYSELSYKVFGSHTMRSTAKKMFLAFCYGMSSAAIARLVTTPTDTNGQKLMQETVSAFFASYPTLQTFRASMAEVLVRDGFASSLLGNRRWRTSVGAVTHKERRWAVNHPVQATASLIFKEALISIATKFGADCILLPVHDAMLLQFDDDDRFADQQTEAAALMRKVWEQRCPGIVARVSAGPFAEV